ncbi:hypothetical protein AMELA_G00062300 [Ameiurus melas]|uniref:Uncharacterized protein n=1 Tax=Ameiurus melas TaxID=219545 RepID=A0A7J6B265_AMEME|nr:hypothetical protein AMELA_G00062300 [Ameiurus melas]
MLDCAKAVVANIINQVMNHYKMHRIITKWNHTPHTHTHTPSLSLFLYFSVIYLRTADCSVLCCDRCFFGTCNFNLVAVTLTVVVPSLFTLHFDTEIENEFLKSQGYIHKKKVKKKKKKKHFTERTKTKARIAPFAQMCSVMIC